MWRCWERWHMCWSHAGKPPASWHNIICRVIFYNTDGQSLCCCCSLILETLQALSVLSRSDVMNVFVTYVTLQWQSLHCGVSMCDVGGVTVSLCDVGGVTVWQSPPVHHNVYTQCGPGRPGTLRPPLICVSGAVTGSSEGCPCTHSDTPPHYPHTPPCRGSSPSPTSSGRPRRTLPVLPPPPLWTGSRSAGRQ